MRAYKRDGYAVAGVLRLRGDRRAAWRRRRFRSYEHGYNIPQDATSSASARAAWIWLDFPLRQTLSNRRSWSSTGWVEPADLVVAQPSHRHRDGYSTEDHAASWRGYQLMEIVERAASDRRPLGRGALSPATPSGRSPTTTRTTLHEPAAHRSMAWNMIDAASPSTRDVVDALRAGPDARRLAHQRTPLQGSNRSGWNRIADGTLLVARRRTVDVQLRRPGRDHPQDSEEAR